MMVAVFPSQMEAGYRPTALRVAVETALYSVSTQRRIARVMEL
jgi:hypothetical protein